MHFVNVESSFANSFEDAQHNIPYWVILYLTGYCSPTNKMTSIRCEGSSRWDYPSLPRRGTSYPQASAYSWCCGRLWLCCITDCWYFCCHHRPCCHSRLCSLCCAACAYRMTSVGFCLCYPAWARDSSAPESHIFATFGGCRSFDQSLAEASVERTFDCDYLGTTSEDWEPS